jgi:hypothetical protein
MKKQFDFFNSSCGREQNFTDRYYIINCSSMVNLDYFSLKESPIFNENREFDDITYSIIF